jgi:hypothetical protein
MKFAPKSAKRIKNEENKRKMGFAHKYFKILHPKHTKKPLPKNRKNGKITQ